jgi:hypothetical protein
MKVLAPFVPAWMKEGPFTTSQRIDALGLVTFREITRGARERSIRQAVRPSPRCGDDVVHVETIAAYWLWGAAVFTTIPGPGLHAGSKLIRHGVVRFPPSCQVPDSLLDEADNCRRSLASDRAF